MDIFKNTTNQIKNEEFALTCIKWMSILGIGFLSMVLLVVLIKLVVDF